MVTSLLCSGCISTSDGGGWRPLAESRKRRRLEDADPTATAPPVAAPPSEAPAASEADAESWTTVGPRRKRPRAATSAGLAAASSTDD